MLIPCSGLDCKPEHIIELLVNVYNFLLGMAAIIAMLFLVYIAIQFLTHQFDDNPESVLTAAKSHLRHLIWGFLLIACAYLIVNTLLAIVGIDKTTAVGQLLIRYGLLVP